MGRCYAMEWILTRMLLCQELSSQVCLKHIDIAVYMAIKDIVEERYTAE